MPRAERPDARRRLAAVERRPRDLLQRPAQPREWVPARAERVWGSVPRRAGVRAGAG